MKKKKPLKKKKKTVRHSGQFQKGNDLWKRSDLGRDKIFETPQKLWDTFIEYCKWQDDNPWPYEKIHGRGVRTMYKKVPYSLMGFVVYCGTSEDYFYAFEHQQRQYIKNGHRLAEEGNVFLRVMQEIRSVIRQNQFNGAASAFFREGLMIRVLELSEKIDHTKNGKDLPAIPEVKVYNIAPPLANSEDKVNQEKS